MRSPAFCFVLVLATIGACSRQPATGAATAARPGAAPQAPAPATQPGPQTVTGIVLETMDAASYTYLRVKTDTGELWAATAQFNVGVGDRVVVPLEMPMKDFHSPSLKRDFPLIYFTSHVDREGQPASAVMPGHAQMGAGSPAAAAAPPMANVAPATGGTAVADVWAKRAALAGTRVTVRGRVVKFNGGILDRNWIHIQDGTGNAKDGSNDLTITSQDMAKVGDVITATGTVTVNKDFGAGYSYGVIVESARILAKQ
jgi:hypothetical protein